MTDDRQLIRMLKSEIQDLQESSIHHMEDLNLRRIAELAVREAIERSQTLMGAARLLGVDRTTLKRHLSAYGIEVRLRCGRPKGEAADAAAHSPAQAHA